MKTDNPQDTALVPLPPAPGVDAASGSPSQPATAHIRQAPVDLSLMSEIADQLGVPVSVFLRISGLFDEQ